MARSETEDFILTKTQMTPSKYKVTTPDKGVELTVNAYNEEDAIGRMTQHIIDFKMLTVEQVGEYDSSLNKIEDEEGA